MTRLQRKHRKDIWFHRYSNLMNRENEQLKKLWFITDEELQHINNEITELKLVMFRDPINLPFSAKRRIISEINHLVTGFHKRQLAQPSILSQAEYIQKAIFNFGNQLLKLEDNSKLKHYQFKVVSLVEPINIEIIRLSDSKVVTSFQFEFDNYSHPGKFIEELAKEEQWQKTFKAEELIYDELFHIAILFGVEKEYNKLITKNKELDEKYTRFGAELYIECYNDTFNLLIDEFNAQGKINRTRITELENYYSILHKQGWKLKSGLWRSLVLYSKIRFPQLAKNIIIDLRKIKTFGNGFYVFSLFHKEWCFNPSEHTIIQLEEALRSNINYWRYE